MKKRTLISTTASLAVATMLMGAGFVATANAAEIANNDITITAPAAVQNQLIQPTVNGRTFKAYRISNYSNAQVNAQGQITGYDMAAQAPFTDELIRNAVKAAVVTGDAVDTNFQNVVTLGNDGNITFKGDAENLTALQFVGKYFYGAGNDVYGNDNADSDQVRTFADYLMKNLPVGATAKDATGADNQVTFDIQDGQEGLYLNVEEAKDATTGSSAEETVSRAMLTGTPIKVNNKLYNEVVTNRGGKDVVYKLGSLKLKAEKVNVEKETSGNDQLIQLNSTREFTITTNVPNYTTDYPNWKNVKFSISDNPSANINPFTTGADSTTNVNGLTVKATDKEGHETTLVKDTHYTVDTVNGMPDDTNDFKINITDPTAWSGQKLVVTYNGVVTATTPSENDTTTANAVNVEFSRNPNVEDDYATITDTEKLFNAQLDMEKVAFNQIGTKLAGAEFEVTKDGQPVKFVKSSDGLTYTLSTDPNASTTNKVVFGVDVDDTIKPVTLDGLAADTSNPVTYTFKETKAPAGYILGENAVTFTVTVTPKFDGNGESNGVGITVASDNHKNFIDLASVTPSDTAPGNGTVYTLGTVSVENTKNISDFAKTGGAIMTMLALAGAATAAGVIAGVAAKRRTNKA